MRSGVHEMVGTLKQNGCPMILTLKQAAEQMGTSVSTVQRLVRRGKIKKYDRKITIKSLAEYLG